MLLRTHLAVIIAAVILFFPHIAGINNKIIFIFIALIATMLPDIDTGFSTLGKMKGFRFLQFFVRHRGFIHSFTFAILISLILAIFWPVASLGFFLGYGLHLFIDGFTIEGIQPFWPYSKKSFWRLKTGSLFETTLFISFVFIDIFCPLVLNHSIILQSNSVFSI